MANPVSTLSKSRYYPVHPVDQPVSPVTANTYQRLTTDQITDLQTAVTTKGYGNMNGYNVSLPLTIAVANTFYEVPAGLAGGTVTGFTFQNGRELKCSLAGTYLINWAMSVACGTVNTEVEGTVWVNRGGDTTMAAHTIAVSASKAVTLAGSGIRALNVDDVVSLCLSNVSGTQTLTLDHATLTLVRL